MKTKRLFALLLCAALTATCLPAFGDETPAVPELPTVTEVPAVTETPTMIELPAAIQTSATTDKPPIAETLTKAEAPTPFTAGYALTIRYTTVYKKSGGAKLTHLHTNSAVYVSKCIPSGTENTGDDWLLCHFASAIGTVSGFIRSRNLSPVASGHIAALEGKITATGSVYAYAGHPLPVLDCVIEEASTPSATPTPAPAATPTPVPGPTEKPVRTAKPLPSGKIVSSGTTGMRMPKGARTIKSALDGYPESGHPYANDMDSYYYYVKAGSSGYIVTFSYDTETEAGFDYLSFYNSDMAQLTFTVSGETYSSFTGTQLAGRTLYITSPSFYVRLKTDVSLVRYGFSFSNITPTYPTSASPTIYLCEQATESSVDLRWNYVSDPVYGFADGFQVYRAATSGGSYGYVKTVSGTTATVGQAAGLSRWYKVRPYFNEPGGIKFGAFSASKGVVVMAKPSITTIRQSGSASAYLAWGDVTGADAYMLYRSTTSGGTYNYLKTVTYHSATDYGLAPGITYYYKVRPYRLYGSKQVDGVLSASAGIGIMGKPVITYVTQTSSHTVRVNWSSVQWASGYMLYRSNAASGTYSYIKSVTLLYTYNNSVPVGTWYYKVVPYRMYGTTKQPGAYSNPVGRYVSY